mgnify:CR=1 FL=1|jgi:hypothetical protein|tara:strand:+ start:557 stop:847 length:291 start_codon:yes stop_codon:yes gene_type:complete
MQNLDSEFIDIIDLVDFTFSSNFVEKWSFKYGRRLARLFQIKIMKSLESRKVLKMSMLYKFLVTDSGFSTEVVKNFLLDVDYEIYSPIISGSLEAS